MGNAARVPKRSNSNWSLNSDTTSRTYSNHLQTSSVPDINNSARKKEFDVSGGKEKLQDAYLEINSTSTNSTSNLRRNEILSEYPELKDYVDHLGTLLKSINKEKEEDARRNTISLSNKKRFDEIAQMYVDFEKEEHRKLLGDELVKYSAGKTMVEYINILTNNGKEFPLAGYGFECFFIVCGICWNFADVCLDFGRQLCESGVVAFMKKTLQLFKEDLEENQKQFIALASSSILHNCARFGINTKYFQDQEIITILAWYAKNAPNSTQYPIATVSVMALAHIVEEKDNAIIQADGTIINTMIKFLTNALGSDDHTYNGFKAIELITGLNRLASNAENSQAIIQKGILEQVQNLLENGSEMEKLESTRTVWALAFNEQNKKVILDNNELMKTISNLSINPSSSKNLKETANGALWVLNGLDDSNIESTEKSTPKKKRGKNQINDMSDLEQESTKHIMISYQWDCQTLMIKLKKKLESEGYKVWMDLEEMGGSTLQTMAEAVEEAAVIIITISRKYKESINCRTEAEYAFKRGTSIVPLKLEHGYEPDGWLGAIVGTKYYFDFTDLAKFYDVANLLMREVGKRGKLNINENIIEVDGPFKNDENHLNVCNWTSKEVFAWSKENRISKLKAERINGKGLLFLRKLKSEAPEFFYRFSFDQLGLTDLQDLNNFTDALHNIN